MKIKIILLTFLFSTVCFFAQNTNDFNVTNIASEEIIILQLHESKEISKRNKIIIEKLYTPYKSLWQGYIGNETDFVKWVNEKAYKQLKHWNNNKSINSKLLTKELHKFAEKMYNFSGHKPYGSWFLIYGPAWTNLGGLRTGEMLIDLSNETNSNNERIIKLYPHELNHQIYHNTRPQSETIVLNRIIDEGFAVFVSYLFHNKAHTIFEELGYSEEEYRYCVENEDKLINLLKKYYLDINESVSRDFANRNYKIGDNYPGAIGYYIGFRIIENYVINNGENSWKDIYTMQPLDVLEKSGFLK